MNLGTLTKYFVGDARAILAIASCRSAWWVGLLFVVSAGLAREYDGEDLRAEPWHVFIPIGASLVTSFVLFLMLYSKIWIKTADRPRFWIAYRSFLTLYWMTAPLAWLYAIPYERLMSAPDSVKANLLTLGLVAAWRVFLMIRVAIVLMGYRVFEAVVIVLFFADGVLQLILRHTPFPIVSLMGGVRLSESDEIIQNVTCALLFWGMLLLPILGLLAIFAVIRAMPQWNGTAASATATKPWTALWILALMAIAGGLAALPFTQPEQRLRYQVESALRAGRLDEGLKLMLAHEPEDFPPHWDPPPRMGFSDSSPPLLDILEKAVEHSSTWVGQRYEEKLRLDLAGRSYYRFQSIRELQRLLRVADKFQLTSVLDPYRGDDAMQMIRAAGELSDTEREECLGLIKKLAKP